jgi:hypothetical protein
MKQINVDRLAGEILKLDREVEGLARAGRLLMDQQVRMIGYVYEGMIKPQIAGSEEAYEMERMLRAMEAFCGLNETEWRRSLKARKQAIDIMRATTEIAVRKLIMNVLERGN